MKSGYIISQYKIITSYESIIAQEKGEGRLWENKPIPEANRKSGRHLYVLGEVDSSCLR